MSSMNTPMPASSSPMSADAVSSGVRLTLPVQASGLLHEVVIEPAHCERLFRMAAYLAIRDGILAPTTQVAARMIAGRVRDHHGAISCLDTSIVELVDDGGAVLARHEFPRATWSAFAAARGLHLQVAGREALDPAAIVYSLHASECSDDLFPIDIPVLPALSIDQLTARAVVEGDPLESWVATFVSLGVIDGMRELERLSRANGQETAGRIHVRVGFDPERKRFVRILDRLVISRATEATASTVLSTGASWGEFLSANESAGPQAHASVHTHLHLVQKRAVGRDGVPQESDHPEDQAIISIDDMVTHYTAFPDPLSAALIVSLFPKRWVVTLYGYETDGRLVREPGYWVLRD